MIERGEVLKGISMQPGIEVNQERLSRTSERMPAAITDTGCERELNEDRYAVIECRSGVAWVVADGLGGVSGGELAAQLAIDAMRRFLESQPIGDVDLALRSAVMEANRILVLRRQNPLFAGMGTTVVGVMFRGSQMSLTHAGDSRAYLVRDGDIQTLTKDHTLVQEMVARGELSVEEALRHPQAHVLTRCLGAEPGLKLDVSKFWIHSQEEERSKDSIVLASDGLYSLVSDAELATIVTDLEPQRACVHLVELAKSRGGYDNITVVVIPVNGIIREHPPEGHSALRASEMAVDNEPDGELSGISRVNWLVLWGTVSSVASATAVFALFTYLFLV